MAHDSKAHIKQGDVWRKQYENTDTTVDLKDYPAVGKEIELWRDGVKMAREAAKYVGMVPQFFSGDHLEGDPLDSNQSCFFLPFSSIAENENLLDQMCLDTKLYDNNDGNNTPGMPDALEGGDTEDIDFAIHNDNSWSSLESIFCKIINRGYTWWNDYRAGREMQWRKDFTNSRSSSMW